MTSKPSSFSITYFFEILNSPRVKPLAQRLHPSTVLAVLKGVFDDAYRELRSAFTEQRRPDVNELLEKIVARLNAALLDETEPLVVDARGRVVADEMERLADVALEECAWLAAEPISEYSRRRDGYREKETASRLLKLSGAESVATFRNVKIARVALLRALARDDRELIVARRDMFERENGERLETAFDFYPNLRRREVGAANAVDVGDYARALGPQTGAIWREFGRRFSMGRVASDADVARLKERSDATFSLIADVEFAPLVDLSSYFDAPIPRVSERLAAGYDCVICDGAQLIGGPNCGLAFGSRELIDEARAAPIATLAPIDRVTMGALAKTLELYDKPERALEAIPALRALSTSVANLESRASRLAAMLETFEAVQTARVVQGRSALCANGDLGGSETRLVELRPRGRSAAELAAILENESPKLLARWTRDALLLDMKTIAPEQDVVVAELFEKLDVEKKQTSTP